MTNEKIKAELVNLANLLRKFAEEDRTKAKEAETEWWTGRCVGAAGARDLSAQWIDEIAEMIK